MFSRKGVVLVEKEEAPEEEVLLELVLEAGAEDVNDSESSWEITTDPGSFVVVRDALEGKGISMVSAELTMVPQNTVPVEGSQAKSVLNLLEALDELDDVQSVYANFDIPESVMAERG
jgi:transcriptional/translational regulatory protein YebC/TACO1